MGRAFKAAAAAADESDVGAGSRRIKAEAAAVAALGFAVSLVRGCAKAMVSTAIHATCDFGYTKEEVRGRGETRECQRARRHAKELRHDDRRALPR